MQAFWDKWGEKCTQEEYISHIWGVDDEITFGEFIDAVDEGLREMMLTSILIKKREIKIIEMHMLLRKIYNKYCNTQFPQISIMVLQYLESPPCPNIDSRIFDSDVLQFSQNGESFENTWRRLVKENLDLVTQSIVQKVVNSTAIERHPDIEKLGRHVYQYYRNRPTVKDTINAISEYDRRYEIMFHGLLIGQ